MSEGKELGRGWVGWRGGVFKVRDEDAYGGSCAVSRPGNVCISLQVSALITYHDDMYAPAQGRTLPRP